jgi:Predicted glycosyltransferases
MSCTPFVSVVIPVFNDSIRLDTCLAALANQTYPSDSFEAVVVDNGSTDDIEAVTGKFAFARLVCESRPSQFAARNTGIEKAKGEVIALTDADCIPAKDWLQRGIERLLRFRAPDNAFESSQDKGEIIAGEIKVFARDRGNPTSVELYDMATGLTQKNYVDELNYAASANMFFHRTTFDAVGNFDDRLKCSGDLIWGQKASSLGFTITYADDAMVEHPARHGFKDIHTKAIRTIGGVEDLARRREKDFTHPLNRSLFFDCIPPVNYCIKILQDRKFTLIERLRIMPVVFFVRYSEALERMRLRMGGVSTRR